MVVAENSAKRSRASSYPTTALTLTDTTQDAAPPPAPPFVKADESTPRDYDLPIPSRMTITDDYERDEDDNDKYEKVEGGDIFVKEAV